MSEILYDYRDGVTYDRYTFDEPDAITSSRAQYIVPGEELTPDGLEEDAARIDAYLREQSERQTYLAPATHGGMQRNIQYGLMNRDQESDDGIIYPYHFQWGGTFNNPVGQREMSILGAKYPNKHFLIINTPGAGDTDRLPYAITKEIAKTGSFISYGEFATTALRSVLNDYDGVGLRGDSQGARLSLAMAPTAERVRDAVLNDPPGSIRLGRLGIANAFMLKEAGHNGKYAKNSLDRKSADIQAHNDSLGNMVGAIGKLIPNGAFIDQFLKQPKAMGSAGLETDLAVALPHVNELLVINTPEFSELTDPAEVRAILSRLALVSSRPKLVQNVILGRTHSYPSANPVVRAAALMDWKLS